MSLRSVDTYYFQVPDTGYYPGSRESAGRPANYSTGTATSEIYAPGTYNSGAATYNAPAYTTPSDTAPSYTAPNATAPTYTSPTYNDGTVGTVGTPYQTGTRSYKIIQYRPGHSQ